MTVIIKGDTPDIIRFLPEVKGYGDNPIQTLESSDTRKIYGDTIIYTMSSKATLSFLINQLDYDKNDLYWQDLDAYGESKIFKN